MKPYIPDTLPLINIDWGELVPAITVATSALARYDGFLQGIVNPSILLAPFTVQEAVLSSRIEGTRATFEEVLEYQADPRKDHARYADIQEILNYQNALRAAVDSLKERPINLNMLKDIHFIQGAPLECWRR